MLKNNLGRFTSKISLLVPILFLIYSGLAAQSIPYQAMLSVLYEDDFPVIKPEEIKDLGQFQVLDTREREEYEVSHLKNATWVGYETFPEFDSQILDRSKPILVYCTVGARSQDIGQKLQQEGFEVYNLYGGIIHWVNENHPVFQNSSETRQVHTYSQAWGIWLSKGEKVY